MRDTEQGCGVSQGSGGHNSQVTSWKSGKKEVKDKGDREKDWCTAGEFSRASQ